MENIFKVIDKTKRIIFLTSERQKYILKHPEMQQKIDSIRETLIEPLKITSYSLEENIRYYYKYFKDCKSKAKYLRVIVKYLNGKGFIITTYFVEHIK